MLQLQEHRYMSDNIYGIMVSPVGCYQQDMWAER